MTIQEADKKGTTYLKNPCPVMPQDIRESFALGIEALRIVAGWRKLHPSVGQPLLPGETGGDDEQP